MSGQSSHVYTAGILLPCRPICSVCTLHNNLRCFPFTLSKYQPDLDIYICLMKYTSSLTVPKWLIYCSVMISIKISSQHDRNVITNCHLKWRMFFCIGINDACLLLNSVKPENPKVFLEQKEIDFEVFLFFFSFLTLRWFHSSAGGVVQGNGYWIFVHKMRQMNSALTWSGLPINQLLNFSLDFRTSLWPWNLTNTLIFSAHPNNAQVLNINGGHFRPAQAATQPYMISGIFHSPS